MSNTTASYKDNPTWFIDRLTLYQNANSSPEAIKRNFLIRIAEFELIVADLRSKKKGDPVQHELILGRRGSGKSTLLRRIQIEIDEQPDLSEKYVAINLAEEQNSIYRLSDLWFEVLEELGIRFKKSLNLRVFDSFEDNQAYTHYLYGEIHRLLQESGKRAVLLLDNLDRILENFDDDANLFRETLLNYPDIQIIGGSTRMNEHFWEYDKPFYDFFRRHRLEGLSFEEIHRLLNHWAAEMELPLLHDYAVRHRGRVEAIRILTDGLPRALQYFIQVLLHDSELYGFDYLKKVMDKATPLYQERLNSLTAPQRKIVQEMAFVWEAAPTKVLVEKCRMESKLIASFLKQLDRFGIVETVPTDKKNHLYRLSERFFNMWLIVTQGNPDQKRRAKYLTLFLEGWYDEHELKELAKQHLTDLQGKKLSFDKAMVLSKGLSQSRYISVEQRDALIDFTLALNPEAVQDCELPRKFSEISVEGFAYFKQGEYEKSLECIAEIENEEDGVKFCLQALCFTQLKKLKEGENYYLQAIEKGHVGALNNLADLYADQCKQTEAEVYYLQAIEKGSVIALNSLAIMYKNQDKQTDAETYYLQAIEKGDMDALYNLAILYGDQGKHLEAETYYLQAIDKGNVEALYNLAILYGDQGKHLEAETYFLQAIDKGHVSSLNNLAILYMNQGKQMEAEAYFLQAIEKGDVHSLNNLAILYENQEKQMEAEVYFLQAIDKGGVSALYNLAFLYANHGKELEAEAYYLQAIEKGDMNALYGLANLYANQGKELEAETYYLQAIEKGNVDALNNLAILYAKQGKELEAETCYLQAIERGLVDALYNLAILYYHQNLQPVKALGLLRQHEAKIKDDNLIGDLLIIEIWNGIFESLPEKIEQVVQTVKDKDLSEFLTDLLHHEQIQAVLTLFESEQHGKSLRNRYELLYYVTLILAGRTEDNLLLRIPPEVLPTVQDIVEKVREKQAFYSRTNS